MTVIHLTCKQRHGVDFYKLLLNHWIRNRLKTIKNVKNRQLI